MVEFLKGPFKITRVHVNGTALIRRKHSKHDNLVNTSLLVKYLQPENEEPILTKANEKASKETTHSENFKEKEGPITRSRSKMLNQAHEIETNEIKPNFDHNSAENIEAIKLINFLTLMCPIKLFKKRILIKKPIKLN